MYYDSRFLDYFDGRLRQIYLYVTDVCSLRCQQCLYKTTLANRELNHQMALQFIADFRSLGAKKMTLIGGEPFLYGRKSEGRALAELIECAASVGYEYIRIDTNGQQQRQFLEKAVFHAVSNVAVSIDGHNAAINDELRGRGSFDKAVQFVREAVELGHYVSITTCVHPGNINHLDRMISLAASLGAKEMNLHPIFKMGIARDSFSGDTDISPDRWVKEYARLKASIAAGAYSISVRVPQRFVSRDEYLVHPSTYDYCPSRMAERILVQPNGDMRICALCIGTPLRIASYSPGRVRFCGDTSEIAPERLRRQPCMTQLRDFGDLIPLCISYKPGQAEFVWVQERVDHNLSSDPTREVLRSANRT